MSRNSFCHYSDDIGFDIPGQDGLPLTTPLGVPRKRKSGTARYYDYCSRLPTLGHYDTWWLEWLHLSHSILRSSNQGSGLETNNRSIHAPAYNEHTSNSTGSDFMGMIHITLGSINKYRSVDVPSRDRFQMFRVALFLLSPISA